MIVAFTGHRPNKLGGYGLPNPILTRVCSRIRQELERLRPDKAISGMALGVDQWAAEVVLAMGIPLVAAVPFKGQENMWSEWSQVDYWRLMAKAAEVVVVSEGGYSPEKMQIRNKYMVDRCDVLIAVWDGTAGGTGNCVKYAKGRKKTTVYINPNEPSDDWL